MGGWVETWLKPMKSSNLGGVNFRLHPFTNDQNGFQSVL